MCFGRKPENVPKNLHSVKPDGHGGGERILERRRWRIQNLDPVERPAGLKRQTFSFDPKKDKLVRF